MFPKIVPQQSYILHISERGEENKSTSTYRHLCNTAMIVLGASTTQVGVERALTCSKHSTRQ